MSTERPRRADYQANRERILAAARATVAERGVDALTVSEVAHRAGLNRTTAYQHFRTRDALVGAVLECLADEVGRLVSQPMDLNERIDEVARCFVEHPEIPRLLLHQLQAGPAQQAGWQRFVAEIQRAADSPATQDGADAEMLGQVLLAIGVFLPLLTRTEHADAQTRAAAADRMVREVKRLLLYGFLRPERWPALVASIQAPANEPNQKAGRPPT